MNPITIIPGDCRKTLDGIQEQSVHCCVTSPPYWGLRNYGVGKENGEIGSEGTLEEYVAVMVDVFSKVWRVLRDDGTLWLNLGDAYASGNRATFRSCSSDNKGHQVQDGMPRPRTPSGLKPKDLCGVAWRVAFGLQSAGWYLRSDIIWSKPNPMPESVTDRPTRSHEYLFLFSKQERYYYDAASISEPAIYSGLTGQDESGFKNAAFFNGKHAGNTTTAHSRRKPDKQRGHYRRHNGFNDRWDLMEKLEQCSRRRNKRDVWTVATANCKESHFATFPDALVKPCILAGCPVGGTVLDPFGGSGTVGKVALELGRRAILCELNPEYVNLIEQRTSTTLGFGL